MKNILLLTALLSILLFTSCSKDEKNSPEEGSMITDFTNVSSIIGTWYITDVLEDGEFVSSKGILTFNADGTYKWTNKYDGGWGGIFTFANGKISCNGNGIIEEFNFTETYEFSYYNEWRSKILWNKNDEFLNQTETETYLCRKIK